MDVKETDAADVLPTEASSHPTSALYPAELVSQRSMPSKPHGHPS